MLICLTDGKSGCKIELGESNNRSMLSGVPCQFSYNYDYLYVERYEFMRILKNLFDMWCKLWYNVLYKNEKEMIRMYSALDVARYVVNYANAHGMIVSNLKLQKILYFIQLKFLLNNPARPCFDEDIEAWTFGPVVPVVYREFKRYGSLGIPEVKKYFDQSKGLWNMEIKNYSTKLTPDDQEVVNEVVNLCDKYSASDLVTITHKQSPLIEAYKKRKRNAVISIESMVDYINRYIRV